MQVGGVFGATLSSDTALRLVLKGTRKYTSTGDSSETSNLQRSQPQPRPGVTM